jgi:thymidylate synthase (FAD)
MKLRVLDESTNEFGIGHIDDIVDSGMQPVYRVTLADGKQLTLTENHRVLTADGWQTMRQALGLLGSGNSVKTTRTCRLMTNGIPLHQDREWMKAQRDSGVSVREIAYEVGCSYHTIRKWLARHDLRFKPLEQYRPRRPWNAGLRGYRTGMRVSDSHRAAIRRARSGERSNFWRGGVTTERASIGRWTRDQAPRVHAYYDDVPDRRGWKLAAHPVAVVAVQYVGIRQTYDLCLSGPWHNFVANGIVVHNSFNEFSMRYAKATDDFYLPEPEDVRTQVGKPGAYSFEPVEEEVAETTREELRAVYDAAFAAYQRLVELGVARELARCVMPVAAYTEFYWTVNARALMNFVSLRAAETAQREIRRYAEAVESFFAEKMPVTHAAFVAAGRVAP